jgi:hypothetical protein
MICSSVNRLGFMSIPLTGGGLYPFLEEIAGLSSEATPPVSLAGAFLSLNWRPEDNRHGLSAPLTKDATSPPRPDSTPLAE